MSKKPKQKVSARTFDNLRPDPQVDAGKLRVIAAFQYIASIPEGQIVFAWMRAQTIERSLGPDASDGALRALEGQRQFVRAVEGMISSGGRTPTPS